MLKSGSCVDVEVSAWLVLVTMTTPREVGGIRAVVGVNSVMIDCELTSAVGLLVEVPVSLVTTLVGAELVDEIVPACVDKDEPPLVETVAIVVVKMVDVDIVESVVFVVRMGVATTLLKGRVVRRSAAVDSEDAGSDCVDG